MTTSKTDVNPASERSAKEYEPSSVRREEHAEGRLTRLIEHQAAKLPSDLFLFAALSAMATSVVLEISGHSRAGRFVGMWPPALLTMGIYNKLVKVLGSR